MTTEVVDILFSRLTMDELITRIDQSISRGIKIKIAFSNPEFVVAAKKSEFLKSYLNSCELNLADGIGIIIASKLYGKSLPERVTGTDFTQKMVLLSSKKGYKIYFLGGKPGIAGLAAHNLKKFYPECQIVGFHDGYFDLMDEDIIINGINKLNPDFLMVCLGNPKQELWIDRNFDKLKARVVFGNGGALDFAAGSVVRAPIFIQNIGLEWIWRLFQDLSWVRFKRMLKIPLFIYYVTLDVIVKRSKLIKLL